MTIGKRESSIEGFHEGYGETSRYKRFFVKALPEAVLRYFSNA